MRKITDFIINKRYWILSLFIILTIISAIVSQKVKINYDIAEYLPDTSETRIGMDIMEEEFSETETSTLNVMFENLVEEEKLEIKSDLEAINGVESVDYDNSENYNKGKNTLYVITVEDAADSQTATDVYHQIIEKYKDDTIYTSGNVSDSNKTVLPFWIIVLAVASALVILLIMCESYVEPFLFLISILMAVVLNKGTNIIFENVSHITDSIAAILQLALSMDYSIMLMNRYDQEKKIEKDKIKAMKNALYKAFQAISSSSVTTIVGLLALVFMSFKIGKDLGFVLAKGVFFSLICIFFVLPALILIFDKWIVKTKKKSPAIQLDILGKFSYRIRWIAVPLFLLVFLISFSIKGNLGIDYTESQTDEINKVFTENNQMAIIYQNKDEEKISKYLEKLENEGKIDEVLGYGNTIHEKLTYDALNQQLSDLGSDVSVEDYLLKILYYDYYHPEQNQTMTFESFINFIEKEAYSNEKTNEKIDENMKKDITRLKNFVTVSSINQKRTSSDIANILEIDQSKIDDIFVYYLSKNHQIQMDLKTFIDFMNKDVLTNEKYAKQIDNTSRNQLNTLSKFTNEQTIQNKMTSSQMAELFGMDVHTIDALYQYYILVNDIDIKMSISEFSNFVLNVVLKDPHYASNFDEQTVQNIQLLATFSNLDTITRQMHSKELSDLFGIEESKVNQILLLKYSNADASSKFSITEFINQMVAIKKQTHYLDDVDLQKLESVSVFAQNPNNMNTTPMNRAGLNQVFGGLAEGLVDNIYLFAGLSDEEVMTPQAFINFVLSICNKPSDEAKDTSAFTLNENTLNQLKLLKMIIDDSVSTNKTPYTAGQLSPILGIPVEQMNMLYHLIDYTTGNISNWTISPIDFVKQICSHQEMDEIKNNIDATRMQQLQLLSTIMESTIQQKTFTYLELSQTIGLDANSIKSIYTVYVASQNYTSLTPLEFVNFILAHHNDSTLAGQIPNSTIHDLHLVQSVMNDVVQHKKYTSNELSALLGIDNEKINLLYGLYSYRYHNQNFNLSLKEFVNFLLKDVMTNPEYESNFDEEQKSNLNIVNGIMNATEKHTTYTADEMFAIIHQLSNAVEKNTVQILYTYYGSHEQYDDTWKMTVEEFVDFLNNDILQDERFTDFIDEDMRKDITEAKTTIEDAKTMLIGDQYSRIVLNTKLDLETPETFAFIQNVKDMLSNDVEEFYIIGNSPMAYEMSQTFNGELNFITIITMIAIFIVVVVTFKSITVPVILVMTIQTAVYLTMGILSIVGENVYFIAILIVQSILMGATIDYAILYTSYYLECRKSIGIKEAIIEAYNQSIHTILTSSSILIIVTLIIANFASAIAAKICKTISEGTLCSTILILTLLPAVLAFCDKWIVKNKRKE